MFDLCIKQNAELGYLQLPCSEELEHLLLMGVWMFWTRLGLYVVSDSVAVLESALFALHCHGVSVSFPIICYVTDAHNYARANTL